ncbi:MAG: glycosyltransferase family 8 protein [Sarcina sp.]
MNILYSTDDKYSKFAGVSMISLFESNMNCNEINIHLVNNCISSVNLKNIEIICKKYKRRLKVYNIDDFFEKNLITDKFPKSGYARLFLSKIKVDKIIYLDCDTIILNSLEELWKTDLGDFIIGGVQDNVAAYFIEYTSMNKTSLYINSGVFLANVKKFRELDLEKKFIEFISVYNGKVPHHDQGVLNGVLENKIKRLHPKYNSMSQFWELNATKVKKLYNLKEYYTEEELHEAKENPVIVHFISKFFGRPWEVECSHPLKQFYLDYLEKSPWEGDLIKGNYNFGIKIRKFIYKRLGVNIFCEFEKLLMEKRKRNMKKIYGDFFKESK